MKRSNNAVQRTAGYRGLCSVIGLSRQYRIVAGRC